MSPPDPTRPVTTAVLPVVREIPRPNQDSSLVSNRPVVRAAGSEAQGATSGSLKKSPNSPDSEASQRAKPQPEPVPTRVETQRAVESLRRALRNFPTNLEISTDDSNGSIVIRLVDASSGEVIRQIPSEDIIRLSNSADELTGWMVREKA